VSLVAVATTASACGQHRVGRIVTLRERPGGDAHGDAIGSAGDRAGQPPVVTQVRPEGAGVVFVNPERSTHLNLHVSLSAEDSCGRRIRTAGRDFGMSCARVGVWHRRHGPPLPDDPKEARRIALEEHRVDLADIEDGINQMLGRDPRLHRPPRLSWENLIRALTDARVPVSEENLIAPLTIELAPEVQAELDGPGT
jgi:hypothetical protein